MAAFLLHPLLLRALSSPIHEPMSKKINAVVTFSRIKRPMLLNENKFTAPQYALIR
jgi:hypothetical protein